MQWWKSWRRQGESRPDAAEERDLLLSAYLDGGLAPPERAAVERRLTDDPTLRDDLEDLHEVVLGLQRFVEMRAPRSFVVSARAAPAPAGLTPLELGVRAGAVAAVAAFVFVIGVDVLGGGQTGVRGQASSSRLAVESANSSLAAASESLDSRATAGGGAAPERAAPVPATDDAVQPPAIVPTVFVATPGAPALATSTPPSPQRQQAEQDATSAVTPAPSRTPPLAVTSTSTMTSALQGGPPSGAATPAAAAPATTTPVAAGAAAAPAVAPAQAATGTPTPRPTSTSTVTPPATPPRPELTAPASGQSSGSSGASAAPSIAPAQPGPIAPTSTPVSASTEESAVAPPVLSSTGPPAPATGGVAGGFGGDSSSGRGLVAPAAQDGSWGQDATRVTVARQNEVDTLRVVEAGLGALALGLVSMTGWLWYIRRREAAADGT